MTINITEIKLSPGVNFLTGKSASGKTLLCKSILWALGGGAISSASKAVSIHLGGVVVKREAKEANQTITVIDQKGSVSPNPADSLRKIGVNPIVYSLGVKGLYSKYYAEEPPAKVVVNGQEIDIQAMSLDQVRATNNKFAGEREILSAVIEQRKKMSAAFETDIKVLQMEVDELNKQRDAQNVHGMLYIMESNECPIYPINCPGCNDEMAKLTREDLKKQVKGIKEIPGFFEELKKKKAELAGKKLRLEILGETWKTSQGKTLEEQLAHTEFRMNSGKDIIAVLESRASWKKLNEQSLPYRQMKDKLVATAKAIGLDLVFDGKKFLHCGKPVEQSSFSEQVMLGYCVQQAADLPLVVVDDFGSLDVEWKRKILAHAKKTATGTSKIVVLAASSAAPKKIEGVTSWHFSGGELAKVA